MINDKLGTETGTTRLVADDTRELEALAVRRADESGYAAGQLRTPGQGGVDRADGQIYATVADVFRGTACDASPTRTNSAVVAT